MPTETVGSFGGYSSWETGSSSSVIKNPDGSYGLFLSGAHASDGDSDAFNQILCSSSRDGIHWSAPEKLLSADCTFSALELRPAWSRWTDRPGRA